MNSERLHDWIRERRRGIYWPWPGVLVPSRRFSLRTLLVLFVALGLAFALAALRYRQWQADGAPFRLAEQLGRNVRYSERPIVESRWSNNSGVDVPTLELSAPVWVLTSATSTDIREFNSIANAYPELVPHVSISTVSTSLIASNTHPCLRDDGLRELGRVRHLESLQLPQSNAHLGEEAWESLQGLFELRRLHAPNLNCTSRVATTIGSLKQLEILELPMATVNDQSLRHLVGLQRLRMLDLSRSNVTNAEMVHVSKLGALEELNLANTKVTSEGLLHLRKLKNLRILHLSHTETDDTAVAPIRQMPRLEWLDLIGTPISPSGFDELHGYENLKVVLRGHNHPAKQSPAAKP